MFEHELDVACGDDYNITEDNSFCNNDNYMQDAIQHIREYQQGIQHNQHVSFVYVIFVPAQYLFWIRRKVETDYCSAYDFKETILILEITCNYSFLIFKEKLLFFHEVRYFIYGGVCNCSVFFFTLNFENGK